MRVKISEKTSALMPKSYEAYLKSKQEFGTEDIG